MAKTNVETLEGTLLVASPQMTDARFQRTVILVLHHNEDGAMGVVLNQRLPSSADHIWEELGSQIDAGDDRAHLGGPLTGSITVLHDVQETRGMQPQGRIYVLQKQEQFDKLIDAIGDGSYRFFVGHAGWSSGQLESEIADGSWLSIPASPDFVFAEDDGDMWVSAMREVGLNFYRDVLGIEEFPEEVSMN